MNMDIKNCSGCENDFYNGKNNLGVDRCWNADSAKLVNRILVTVDMPPPYKRLSEREVPNCYKEKGYVKVAKETLTADGYWRK
jgi:hypothetical protein